MIRTCGLVLGLGIAVTGCRENVPGGPGATPSTTPTTPTTPSTTPNSTTPGTTTPGTTPNTTTTNTTTDSTQTFTLSAPALATHVKQGESAEFSVSINRGSRFDQQVTLEFPDVPAGVTIEPAAPKIPAGTDEVTVRVLATETAAAGNYNVVIVGHPATGADARSEVKITVDSK